MLLFYIRHGDPTYNPDTLTPLGKRQAEAVAKRLSLYGIDEIYASTSERAILTATPTAEILKKEITQLDFCNEKYAWDEFAVEDEDGRRQWFFLKQKYRRILVSREVAALGDEWYDYPLFKDFKFKEGIMRIAGEADNFLKGLGYEHDREKREYKVIDGNDKRIAIFAHHGFGMGFLSSILDIPYPIFASHFDICHTGITVIEFRNKDGISIPNVLTVSNDSHIYREGLPTNYNNTLRF